jgi:glutathione-dependent peroxiredoxin
MSKPGCPFCAKARDLLTANGIEYEQVELGNGLTTKSLYAISGAGTTPQVFIDGRLIGGSDDLEAYFKK